MENSHASTALSYADGLAKAFALRGADRRVVAVVGDGALTGGMCWEALNNLGAAAAAGGRRAQRQRPLLRADRRARSPPTCARCARRDATGNLFEDLGLAYLGPVDGHDVGALERHLRRARDLGRPVVVHCVTVKGKGYPPAEADEADRMHAVGPARRARARRGRRCSAGPSRRSARSGRTSCA